MISWDNTTRVATVFYDTNNKYSATEPTTFHKMRVKGCLEGDVCQTEEFELQAHKDCSYSSLNPVTPQLDYSFIINTPITAANENNFVVSAFTRNDNFCAYRRAFQTSFTHTHLQCTIQDFLF